MKTNLARIITSGMIAVVAALGLSTLSMQPAYAIDCSKAANINTPTCAVKAGTTAAGADNDNTCGANQNQPCTLGLRIKSVIDILLFLIGAISVVMIILGGFRYVLSNGDSSAITSAKNTILYAVIGLVVALLAYAIVGFVVGQFVK